jgi:hypothetical protein
MLPTLAELGIEAPAYLRKIDSRAKWYPEGCNTIEERARVVAEKLFREPGNLYSIWLVSTEKELYSVVASLSEYRSPKNQNIDFIWMTESELQEIGISINNHLEGGCLYAQRLHFNAQIDLRTAEKLCAYLIRKEREPKRCTKSNTTLILAHQKHLGCQATDSDLENCECEYW